MEFRFLLILSKHVTKAAVGGITKRFTKRTKFLRVFTIKLSLPTIGNNKGTKYECPAFAGLTYFTIVIGCGFRLLLPRGLWSVVRGL